jgi:hypothetical protein
MVNHLAYVSDERNPDNHGFIVPAHTMSFEHYEEALYLTRALWEIVIP